MKTAIVLSADAVSLEQHAHEINAVLEKSATGLTCLELWIFYQDREPDLFPEFGRQVTAIKLIPVEHPHLPESYLNLLEQLMVHDPMDLLMFSSDGLGAELATRTACRLNGTSCLKVDSYRVTSGQLEVVKPVYGNNLEARFGLAAAPYCLSAARKACQPMEMAPCEALPKQTIRLQALQPLWVKAHHTIADPPKTGLLDADLVLVVGQGAGNRETVDLLQGIASSLGAEMGASRPVVMNAWTDFNRLVGVSGWIISPRICIAAGVSGTAVFNMGIQNSEFIVAVNQDGSAPIFQIADVGIVGDLKAILLELEKHILLEKGKKDSSHG